MIPKKGNDCLKSMIVQGHLGLTPQTAVLLGGFKVQGKGRDAGLRLLDDAKRIEEAGFSREEADALFEVLESREIR